MGFWSKLFGFGKKEGNSSESVQEAPAMNETTSSQAEESSAEVSQENTESSSDENEQVN